MCFFACVTLCVKLEPPVHLLYQTLWLSFKAEFTQKKKCGITDLACMCECDLPEEYTVSMHMHRPGSSIMHVRAPDQVDPEQPPPIISTTPCSCTECVRVHPRLEAGGPERRHHASSRFRPALRLALSYVLLVRDLE